MNPSPDPSSFPIVIVPIERILDLRYRELIVMTDRTSARLTGDDDPRTVHLAMLGEAGEPVVCATLVWQPWRDQPAYRLRGMATDRLWQGRGLGGRVLARAEQIAGGAPEARWIWCEARLPAAGFYARFGWQATGQRFMIQGVCEHIRMCKPLHGA